ncbi:MAG: hypothetical protein WC373_05105 [Smithella sp.]
MKCVEKPVQPETAADLTGRVVWTILKTPKVRKLVTSIVHEAMKDWAGDSKIKARMSSTVEKIVDNVLSSKGDAGNKIAGAAANLITTFARETNEEFKQGLKIIDDPRRTAINDFIVNTDFGEIKEMADRSEEHILQTLEVVNACIWPYPAKIGSLVATLVSAGNISVKSISTLVGPLLKYLGPDLTADILLSVVRELDGKEIGKFTNTLSELVRRLHTGSLLLAKGGKPLFEIYLTNFLKDAVREIDPEIFTKARIALAEDGETIAKSLAEVLSENEEILFASLSAYSALENPKIRAKSIKMRLYEDAEQEKFIAAATKGIIDLDTQDMAETLNAALRIINSIYDAKPDLFTTLVRGFADSVDEDELGKTARWIIPEIVGAFKPLVPAVMPSLINGFCEMVNADQSDETKKAIQNLRSVILADGGAK